MANSSLSFADDVKKILDEYQGDVVEVVAQTTKEVARDAVKKLKAESPRKTGRYAKGWTYNTEKGRLTASATVYGKSGTYQLAHLLEKGHAKRNGGRVRAIPHIAPVEEWANEELMSKTSRRLEGI